MPRARKKEPGSESFFEKEERQFGAAGNLASTTGQASGSASATVRQAEWTGQFQWDNANHPAKAAKAEQDWLAETQLRELGFDPDDAPDWIEIKRDPEAGDTLKCTLCNAVITAEHLVSTKHTKRIGYCVPAPAPVAATGYPATFPAPAPPSELTIEEAFREWGIRIQSLPIPSYYVVKDDGWGGKGPWCTLCKQCCTAEHVLGKNHRKKIQWEEPGSW